jgi:hypothetical protein
MSPYNPPLQVVQFIGTRRGDAERGPQVQINSTEAKLRMVESGELVWVQGPRRNESPNWSSTTRCRAAESSLATSSD